MFCRLALTNALPSPPVMPSRNAIVIYATRTGGVCFGVDGDPGIDGFSSSVQLGIGSSGVVMMDRGSTGRQ